METKQVSRIVDSWIIEEDFPANASLKPIRQFDGLVPDDEDEKLAYYDFIRWYLMQEHLALQDIPTVEEGDFWTVEIDELGNNVSAFNTHDFEKLHPFDKYHWMFKKMCERVRDLAITYSILRDEEAKKRIKDRFLELARINCRDKMTKLFEIWREYAYKD